MSLSEAPLAKITYRTAHDVSDEILGGAIKFCRETGFNQNIMMLSLFSAAFLLRSKETLLKHSIFEDVLTNFTSSIGKVFSNVLTDSDLKDKVSEMHKHYFDALSNDFSSLNSEEEVLGFFSIAKQLNSQGDNSSSVLSIDKFCGTFPKVASVIQSSIYSIVHQIDNGMTIEYRHILDEFTYARYNQEHANRPVSTPTTNYTPTQSRTTYTPPAQTKQGINKTTKVILIIVAIILGIVIIANIANNSKDDELTPVSEPMSGQILTGSEPYNESEITITASGGASCVVKLKTSSGIERMSFYVRAGDTVTVGVPCEYLYVYFASGDTWYGTSHLFGENTSYSMDDTICNFTEYTWEYTLYPVSSGNFSQTPIDEDEFR